MATPDKAKALLMILGKPKGAPSNPPSMSDQGNDDDGNYDDDLKAALGDLAAALGVSVKDPARGVEALKAIHALCDQAGGTE